MINKIRKLKAESTNKLKVEVLNYIADTYKTDEEIKCFMGDLLQHGCQSGMVGFLIYYCDTSKFFDKFEDEIEDLITNSMEEQGIKTRPLFINGLNGSAENLSQEKNLLSWFAFEEMTREINQELELNKDYC